MKSSNYLFVCAYAQSRSKYFAEHMMLCGEKAMFVGHQEEADFKITKEHLEWADVIVLLCKEIERSIHLHQIQFLEKRVIQYYIDDEPSTFSKLFSEFIDNEVQE